MAFLAFLLAVGALIWAFKNQDAVRELRKQQLILQREIARLSDRLTKALAGGQEPAPRPVDVPKPEPRPAPEPPPLPRAEKPLPLPSPLPPPLSTPPSRPQPKPSFDWESLVGVKLFSWIAGIALVFAAIFFLRYSVERGWLGPPMRVAIGLVTGISLLILCEWKVARRYAVTANALDGAGIAILFATFFAANSMWGLLGVIPTFAMMVLVTFVAVLLSLHHNSVFVALLGLVGGFATPALLSTGEDRPIGLFTYLLLLNAGLAWVAYHKRWPLLTVFSSIFTTLYQWGWVARFLQPGTLPLALTIFTVFPVLAHVALTFGERNRESDQHSSLFRQASAISMALPLLFTVYMAVRPSYGAHYWLLFGFLFLLDAGLAVIAARRGPGSLHLAGGMGTVVSLWAWLQSSYTSAAWPAILAVVSVFVVFYLATGYWIRFKEVGTYGVFIAPLLMVAFPVLASIEPAVSSPGILFTVLFVLVGAVAAYSVVKRDSAVYLLAAVFVLTTEAVWSVKHLRPGNLLSALFIYAIFALLYLCVPILQNARRPAGELTVGEPELQPSVFLALNGHGFLLFVALNSALAMPAWPFLITLGVLNLAIAFAALYTRQGGLHMGALIASQFLLVMWQGNAQADSWPAVGAVSTVCVAGIGAAVFLMGRRRGMETPLACVLPSFIGMVVLATSAMAVAAPGVWLLTASLTILLCFILLVDKVAGWHVLAPTSVIASALVILTWSARHFVSDNWSHEFLFAAAIHLLYLAYPLFLGSALRKSLEPHLAAVISSAVFFLFARHSLMAGGFENHYWHSAGRPGRTDGFPAVETAEA